MEQITLQQVVPDIFARQPPAGSEIWGNQIAFNKGQTYLLQAASGKGKTSLCSYLHGSRDDYAGQILFDHRDAKRNSPREWGELRRTSIGILLQGLRLFPELSAIDNIRLKNRLTRHRSEEWIRETLESLDIADKTNAPVAKISFGQQQRVALARALCQPLDFLLLDEPVSHLDDDNNRRVADLLAREATRHGFAIIVTSIGKHPPLSYNQTLRL
ncbi:MAG: ATP-binding cassette domain-containing protein [Odoribacteraceae bacterium]|jgi:ABC-type lipoprotein export system ATPase subunit|nr:ATP-binding cassette domain-containing protein [Odoribacteraceae bacterium]